VKYVLLQTTNRIQVNKEGKIGSRPISRVLWRALRPLTAIPLGPGLLRSSSHLPASSAGHVIACLFGVAPGGGCLVSPPTQFPAPGLVSVALFLASRRAGITRHPTLWSPDFPLRAVRTIVEARLFRTQRLSGRLPVRILLLRWRGSPLVASAFTLQPRVSAHERRSGKPPGDGRAGSKRHQLVRAEFTLRGH